MAMWWDYLRKSRVATIIIILFIDVTAGQAYLAPANMGIVVGGEGDMVEAIPGHNPNMAPWFDELDRPSKSRGLPPEEQTFNGPVIDRRPGDFLLPDEVRKERKERLARKAAAARKEKRLKKHKGATEDDTLAGLKEDESTDLGSQASASTELEDEVASREGSSRGIIPIRHKFDYDIVPRGSSTPVNNTINVKEPADHLEDPFRPRPIPATGMVPRRTVDARIPEIYITNTVTMKLGLVTTIKQLVPTKSHLFSTCLYGCDTISYDHTLVTVLPMRLPCSLVSCPPCPTCVPSTVRVSVCPFITTVTPPGTTSLVNGPTITIVRSTVTRTACTLTKTVTLKPGRNCNTCQTTSVPSGFLTGWNAGDFDDAFKKIAKDDTEVIQHSSTTSNIVPTSIIPTADEEDEDNEGVQLVGEKIRFDKKKPRYRDLRHLINPSQVADVLGAEEEEYLDEEGLDRALLERIIGITVTKTITSTQNSNSILTTTITTTMLSMTRIEERHLQEKHADHGGGICSTFIICNPTQFTCPAQITHAPQLQGIVQSILDAQQFFGTGVVEPRRRSPNGAFIDQNGKPIDEDASPMQPVMGPLGDGSDLAGGFNAQEAFGPGGIFAKAMGLIPSSKSSEQVSTLVTTTTVIGPTSTITIVGGSKGKAHRAGVAAVSSSASHHSSINHRFAAIISAMCIFIHLLYQ